MSSPADSSNSIAIDAQPTAAPTRASRRKERVIKTILDAAEMQFIKNGFHATTMESIANDVDMAVGSLYFYFANKDALYYATLERGINALEGALMEALVAVGAEATPVQQLYAISDAYIQFAFSNVAFFRMLLFPHTMPGPGVEGSATLKHNQIMKERTEFLLALLRSVIEQAFVQGKRRPIPYDHAARFLFGAWNGVIALYLRDDTLRLEQDEVKAILEEARWVLMEGTAVVVELPAEAHGDYRNGK